MNKNHTLIIGQGIAGSLVAFMLHLRKMPFTVIDPGHINTPSRIAAGMFTPVSGKRKAIHPEAPQQISLAIKTYKEIEQMLGSTICHLQNIYQVHHSEIEKNELTGKLANADFAKYIITGPALLPGIKQEMGAFEITHSGWIDCGLLISRFAQWLKKKDALIEAEFSYEDLHTGINGFQYHEMSYSNIVFCEGYRAIKNPFFKNVNIIPCKGDMLTIKYEHPLTGRIVKKNGFFLIPAGNNIFRAGSTYYWNNDNTQPAEKDKKLMEQQLDAMLENKYTTTDHTTAVRPTTKDREVIALQHPDYPGMFILNGLGTRGVLHGPWWAKQVVDLLLQYTPLADAAANEA